MDNQPKSDDKNSSLWQTCDLLKLVVTSPPYNLGKPYETRLDLDEYLNQQRKVIEESVRILDDSGSVCWQVGNYVDNGNYSALLSNADPKVFSVNRRFCE